MSDQEDKKDNPTLTTICLGLFAGALFVVGSILSLRTEPASATVTYAAAIFCLIFAFLSRFKKFKGLGIEAELWEQKQQEAVELIEKMRSIAETAAEQLVNLSVRTGRADVTTPRREFAELVKKIEVTLSSVGVDQARREQIKHPYYKITAVEMAQEVTEKIDGAIQQKINDQQAKVNKFGSTVSPDKKDAYDKEVARLSQIKRQKVDWGGILSNAPGPEIVSTLEGAIDAADCLSADEKDKLRADLSERVDDLKYWVETKQLRRPDDWFAGGRHFLQ